MKKSYLPPNKNFILPKKQSFKGQFSIDVEIPQANLNKTPSQLTPVKPDPIFGSKNTLENLDSDR
jgi:hypothetical protein